MCGIAGISLPKGQKTNQQQLQPLADNLAHRGPNGQGFFAHGTLGLAHRRLSIIDLATGQQPLKTGPQGAPLALVANGEIYNYQALQTLAKQNGALLTTGSDCEPPLHRFAQIGQAMFSELQGMYAIALADAATETLYLATDPFGIKPLYYAETGIGFIFASQPSVLTRSGWVRPEANLSVLPQLLNRHYSTGSSTLFKGIQRMLPGERLVVRHGKIISRNRQLPKLLPAQPLSGSSIKIFEDHLTAAVERHLQAHVPYGILLSGGLDSTALTLAMQRLGAPIHAFTAQIQLPNQSTGPDESVIAAALAHSVGAKHTTVPYGITDFWPMLAQLAWHMDDLNTDYAALPLLKLTQTATQHVKILLSGEGGDELLGGYSNYRKHVNPLLAWWKNRRSGDAAPFQHLFKTAIPTPAANAQPWPTQGFTKLQLKQAHDLNGWLPHDLLPKLDRTTMAHGIEGRVPYLDDTFSQFAFSLPDSLKVNEQFGKLILRQHLAAHGHETLAWARKQGFSVAVGPFMAERKEFIAKLWQQSPLLQSIIKPSAKSLLNNLNHPKSANLAFSLTLVALWHRLHVQGHPLPVLTEQITQGKL